MINNTREKIIEYDVSYCPTSKIEIFINKDKIGDSTKLSIDTTNRVAEVSKTIIYDDWGDYNELVNLKEFKVVKTDIYITRSTETILDKCQYLELNVTHKNNLYIGKIQFAYKTLRRQEEIK